MALFFYLIFKKTA
jgi:hypothetical protein